MSFQAEPPYSHGQEPRTAVLLCNLGTPDEPTAPALRRYLGEFLGDPRVVEIPRLVWMAILHGIILRVRPAKSAAKYAGIWTAEGSPLKVWTERQAAALSSTLQQRGHAVTVRYAMRYGNPSMASVLDELKAAGVTRVLVLPAYPQYSGTTTASVIDAAMQWATQVRNLPEFRFVNRYHDHPGYIASLAHTIRAHWAEHGRGDHLVMSFHGVPERTLQLGDPYHCECHKTARLVAQALEIPRDRITVTFQSRFGKAKWLEPYTEPTLIKMAGEGLKKVDLVCPGFTSDCLETLEEINMEAREAFLHAGGEAFSYIPCLNSHPVWLDALADLTEQHLQGWPTRSTVAPQELQAARERALAMGATN